MVGGAVAHPSLHSGQAPAATPEPDMTPFVTLRAGLSRHQFNTDYAAAARRMNPSR